MAGAHPGGRWEAGASFTSGKTQGGTWQATASLWQRNKRWGVPRGGGWILQFSRRYPAAINRASHPAGETERLQCSYRLGGSLEAVTP